MKKTHLDKDLEIKQLVLANKRLQKQNDLLTKSYNYSEAIFDNIHEPMLILNKNLQVKSASKSYYKKFLTTKKETEGASLFKLGNNQWDIPKLRELLDAVLSKNSRFENFEVTHVFPVVGEKIMLLNASSIIQKTKHEKLILLALEDITERSIRQQKMDGKTREDIRIHKEDKLELEIAAKGKTKQLQQKNIELESANKKLAFQNDEKEKRADELIVANTELAFQNNEKEKRAAELGIANIELAFQNNEKEKRADELIVANTELAFQNNEKEKRADELIVANTELAFQNNEKEKRADELIVANTELAFQNNEKEKRAAELGIANIELAFQNNEKEKRAAELGIANIELAFQNNEKEKRANELIIANTELAFQNNEKEKRAEELSIANQDLTSFTYISSHDLQEPLRKIQTFINCIHNEKETLSDKSVIYFQRITKTAKRMQQLIEDLLTYSRTKSNERVFENTDLNLLINDIKKDFEDIIDQNNVIIETVNLTNINIIQFQFRQLLHNLISNSLKFSKTDINPHILITSEIALGNTFKNTKLTDDKNYCHITYTDNGIGFDAQYKDRIFEVFQRLHSVEEYSGTGIGLAICKRIIENHNGVITANGELNKGAQFDIYIPLD